MSAGSDLAAKGGQSGADAYAASQALASAAKPRQRGGTGAAQGFDAKHPRTAKGRTGGGQFAVKAKAQKQSGGRVVKEPRTPAEIAAFQKSRGLPVTGKMDARTRTAIRNAQEAARQDAAKEKAKGAGSTRGSSRATSVKLKPGEYAKAGMGSPEKPDARVTNVQRTLDRLGYDVGINGVFGAELTRAVRMFQQNHRLPVTGVVDERTKKWLEVKLAKIDAGKASDHAGLTADTPGTKRNRRTGNVKPVSKKGATGRVAVAREKREREERDREREKRKRRPGGGQQAAGKATQQTRVVMEAEFELLHPRDRRGRWRKKLGLKRLELKGDKRLTKPQVRSRAQKVADAFIDFYGGGKVEALYEPEYLASVGSDARFRHEGELMAGLMYGANAHEKMTDPDYGVEWFRVIAHEAAHSISAVTPGPLPGFSQTVEEGAAEILSLWFWKHRGQEFDKRDAAHVDGAWTAAGVESLAHHVAYREWTAEVMRRVAGKVGWDRAAIIDQVEELMRSSHYERIRFRDEQPMAPPPEGVGEDAVSLVRWLLSDDAITEADFTPNLHPRGRDGKFVAKMWHGTTSRRGLGKIRPGFFATSSESEAKDYASIDDYFDPEDQGKLHPVTVTLKNPKHFYGSYPGHQSPELRGLEEKGYDGVVVHFPPVTAELGAAMDERTWAYAFQPDAVKIGHDDEPGPGQTAGVTAKIGKHEVPVTVASVWNVEGTTTHVIGAFAVIGDLAIPMGAITIDRVDHTVELVAVQNDQRRRGIARALYQAAKVAYPDLKHTERRSSAGDAFARSMGGDLPGRVKFADREAEARANGLLSELYGIEPHTLEPIDGPVDGPADFEPESLSAAEKGLVEYLETIRSMQASRYKGEYQGYEDFVLRHGKLFQHGPGESAIEYEFHATTAKQCFRNALTAALQHPELTYVEGWAYTGLIPVHHAWLVDADGRVHDPTWDGKDLGSERVYLGVPFSTDYLAKTVLKKRTDTLLDREGGVPLDKAAAPGMLADVPGRAIQEAFAERAHPRGRGGKFRVKLRHELMGDPLGAGPHKHRISARDANGRLVGVVGFTTRDHPDPDRYDEQRVKVDVLEVNPRVRRRGIGSQLVDEMVRLFPPPEDEEVDWGSFTPDGSKFHKDRTGSDVKPTTGFVRERKPEEWYEGAEYAEPPPLEPVFDAPKLKRTSWEGRVGDLSHITQDDEGYVDPAVLSGLYGVKGERPHEHRNKHGKVWDDFVQSVRDDGVKRAIFVTVNPGEQPKISEGNHRRDAAVAAGLRSVPVHVRYFGHAEREHGEWLRAPVETKG